MSQSILLNRGFVRIQHGLVHFRSASTAEGEGHVPLYMAHAGPLSSRSLVDMIPGLSAHRPVVAPDMPGNGDSDPPPVEYPSLRFYVDCVVEFLDKQGIERVDFYGQHTGAHIGCELALNYPERVRSLIMDGVGLFPESLRQQMVEDYAPPVRPDDFGGHLAWSWNWIRDLFLHFPHFLRDPAHRLNTTAIPSAEVLHAMVVDLLKVLPTYHWAYHAVFRHSIAERLPLLSLPTLVMAVDGDPLAGYLDEAATLIPAATKRLVPRGARVQTIDEFLRAQS